MQLLMEKCCLRELKRDEVFYLTYDSELEGQLKLEIKIFQSRKMLHSFLPQSEWYHDNGYVYTSNENGLNYKINPPRQ